MANPKIQLRHDTSTNWQTQNPVLLEGEVAIETDSNKVKIGNGTDNYNTLPYITDQTKIDLDYSNADYQPVDKSGDTMTGSLTIVAQYAGLMLSGIDPSKAETNYRDIVYKNNTGNRILGLRGANNGSQNSMQIYMCKYGTDENAGTVFSGSCDSSGNRSCSFANTTCCDGQWVTKSLTVESAVTFAHGDVTKQFSLSSYLPNDGKEYLVLGNWNGNSADAYLEIALTSDVITANTQICRIPANSNGGTSFVFPVGTGRYIKRRANNHSSSKSTGNCYLFLMGYRRIGTNA